ncbi:PEP-CTERM sorting domain-containing protein [Duganella qianjiadongensis]|uniref:PEP-CTERM sorting domain-containing protein n=1 Tax=Duganella qianjiadongensis TaxID=2692176 RepID=A0ABW9VDV6_9BURK|nr:PEP-CTERM sorting domain-containing protein [Duganella qianjiadongensis]MYM37814.1 PEP-CTERM sorting domain-containing protein [Duganella qianjiadongensis]
MKKIPLLLAGLALAGSSNAAVLQFDFTAKIQEMVQFSPLTFAGGMVSSSDLNGSTVSVGDAISGHFTYDTSTAQISNVGGLAMFSAAAAQNALNAAIGTTSLGLDHALSNTTTVQVGNNVAGLKGADSFGIANVSANGQASQMMALMLFDSTGHAFSDSTLPAALDFSAFGTSTFYYTYSSASTHAMMGANGSLTSLTVTQLPTGGNPTTPVPEPETYAMLLAGLGLLGWTARRRQAR